MALIVATGQPRGVPGAATLHRIRSRAFVVATGAVERSLAFVDNDRPGVMLIGAAERLLSRYGVPAGRRVVLFGNHDRLYSAARRLMAGGIRLRAIVDTRGEEGERAPRESYGDLERAGVQCLQGYEVVRASGRPAVSGAVVCRIGGSASTRTIDCDAILMSGGWAPSSTRDFRVAAHRPT